MYKHETIPGQIWTDVRFTQDKKFCYLVINGEHHTDTRSQFCVPADQFEHLRQLGELLKTICPLCFEYPVIDQTGTIDFF
jgi:hypothetical protein